MMCRAVRWRFYVVWSAGELFGERVGGWMMMCRAVRWRFYVVWSAGELFGERVGGWMMMCRAVRWRFYVVWSAGEGFGPCRGSRRWGLGRPVQTIGEVVRRPLLFSLDCQSGEGRCWLGRGHRQTGSRG